MAPRDPPTPWELQVAISEIDDRVWNLKRAMDDLVAELRPVLADLAYHKRRQEEADAVEHRSWFVLKVLAGLAAAMPVAIEGYVQLAHHLFG